MQSPSPVDVSQQKLLSIIYQTPVGVIEMDRQGTIRQINAKGLQLLMPFFVQEGLQGDDLLLLLDRYAPQLRRALQISAPAPTPVCTQVRVVLTLRLNQVAVDRHFWITINKQSEEAFTVFFDDFTELHQREQALHQAILKRAVLQGKHEVASRILQDVADAVVAFGSYLTRIRGELEGVDADHVRNLAQYLEKCRAELAVTLGETKARAIVRLLKGLLIQGENPEKETSRVLEEQLRIVTHIQEIFSIQRPSIQRAQGLHHPRVNVHTILNDCVARQLASLDRQGIEVTLQAQTEHTHVSGDRTQLMEVFLTLLRNSQEAFDRQPETDRRIRIDLTGNAHYLTVCLADNGAGFDSSVAESLFQQRGTLGESGSGPSLAHCRSIIESHGGRLDLTSPGVGQGGAALVTFSLVPIHPLP